MQVGILPVDVPDPMHPDPWIEQDEPLASDRHRIDQTYTFDALYALFDPAIHYVSFERWLRMDPTNPRDRLIPDLLVALDLPPAIRDPDEYDPVVMDKAPDWLAEYLSPSSVQADTEGKPLRYAQLGVREYFLFDVDGTYRVPRVQGWRLARDGSRERLPIDAEGGVTSEVIPVRFVVTDGLLQVQDRRTNVAMPRYADAVQALRHTEEEVERLRAEVERLQRGKDQQP